MTHTITNKQVILLANDPEVLSAWERASTRACGLPMGADILRRWVKYNFHMVQHFASVGGYKYIEENMLYSLKKCGRLMDLEEEGVTQLDMREYLEIIPLTY